MARLYRKCGKDFLTMAQYFKAARENKDLLMGYEVEHAKYTKKIKNAHEAFMYLDKELENIKEKTRVLRSKKGVYIVPKWDLAYDKARLYCLKLLVDMDCKEDMVNKRFDEYLKSVKSLQWEKPHFIYAKFIDQKLEEAQMRNKIPNSVSDRLIVYRMSNYLYSIKFGQKYLWQSLPKALELWFKHCEDNIPQIETISKKIYEFETYKLAQVYQILLSKFHQRSSRIWVARIIAKIASEYPSQFCWSILHFKNFYYTTTQNRALQNLELKKDDEDRKDFATQVMERVKALNESSFKIIKNAEELFKKIIKLAEDNQNVSSKNTNFEIKSDLLRLDFSKYKIAMPIEENMVPNMPKKDSPKQRKFAVFKAHPVYVAKFYHKGQVMLSKEKPKKIGLIGTDGKVYFFLLKHDQNGDLRKEARFMEYCNVINRIFENDYECQKRNIKLITYTITPLSRNTGLIEWIENTTTFKSICSEQWRNIGVKCDMNDIKTSLRIKI
jgi:serine/threonine-protein kinase ATR